MRLRLSLSTSSSPPPSRFVCVHNVGTHAVVAFVGAFRYRSTKDDFFYSMPRAMFLHRYLSSFSSNLQSLFRVFEIVRDGEFQIVGIGDLNQRSAILQSVWQREHPICDNHRAAHQGLEKSVVVFPSLSTVAVHDRNVRNRAPPTEVDSNNLLHSIAEQLTYRAG